MGIQHNLEDNLGFIPYELVYEKKVMFPIEFEIKTLRRVGDLSIYLSSTQRDKIQHINALDEYRQKALFHIEIVQ